MASNNENNKPAGGVTFPYGIPGRQLTNPTGAPLSRATPKLNRIPTPTAPAAKDLCDVCDRKVGKIICGACGYECRRLRAQKICQKHPNRKFYQDLSQCPQCRTSNLQEADDNDGMETSN